MIPYNDYIPVLFISFYLGTSYHFIKIKAIVSWCVINELLATGQSTDITRGQQPGIFYSVVKP